MRLFSPTFGPSPSLLVGSFARSMASLLLTTTPGIESIVLEEVRELLRTEEPYEVVLSPTWIGIVRLNFADAQRACSTANALLALRTVHDVLLMYPQGLITAPEPISSVGQVRRALEGLLQTHGAEVFPELEPRAGRLEGDPTATPFRVTTEVFESNLNPPLGFHANDVEREVGEVIFEHFNVVGDMKAPKVNIRVDIVNRDILVSRQVNPHGEPLSRRFRKAFVRNVTIKPNLANAMIRLSGLTQKLSQQSASPSPFAPYVCDPFCGSGTILLEVAAVTQCRARCIGIERSKVVVEGAKANVVHEQFSNVEVVQGDARKMWEHVAANSLDYIITNPPWGVRVNKSVDLESLYHRAIVESYKALKKDAESRAVFLILRARTFLERVRCTSFFDIVSMTVVKTGNMVPTLFVLKPKLNGDEVHQKLTERVEFYSSFIRASAAKPSSGDAPQDAEDDS